MGPHPHYRAPWAEARGWEAQKVTVLNCRRSLSKWGTFWDRGIWYSQLQGDRKLTLESSWRDLRLREVAALT